MVSCAAQKYRQGLAKIQVMGGAAGRGGRASSRCAAYPAMMGGAGAPAIDPTLAAQLATPVGQREYLNCQLQQVRRPGRTGPACRVWVRATGVHQGCQEGMIAAAQVICVTEKPAAVIPIPAAYAASAYQPGAAFAAGVALCCACGSL